MLENEPPSQFLPRCWVVIMLDLLQELRNTTDLKPAIMHIHPGDHSGIEPCPGGQGRFLDGNLEDVDIEVTDRSGGRADIEVRFPGFTTVIECKRTKGKTTRKGLRRSLGQTVAYQAGGITLGMLVVLDLTPKPSWIPNIRDDMWADRIPSPVAEQRDRWAVVVRVPGNRTSPYDMTTPATIQQN
ncbi:hypothetical protein ACFRCI_47985 [Streptomyces sp. NPDC056638]|uniref:hypothetical protein n=1 Tax=Streptomyces sp. NPDC056638 TaxID=3345887 RepID=UPI0036A2C3CC